VSAEGKSHGRAGRASTQTKRRIKKMKDHIQRARCFKGYARRDVTNKQARSRVKNEDRKALKREDN
jgi:hypothetical protein